MSNHIIYKLWSPELGDMPTMEKLWDALTDPEKKMASMRSGLSLVYAQTRIMDIRETVKPKGFERLVSLLIAGDLNLTMPLTVFGNDMFKRHVPMIGKASSMLLNRTGAKTNMSILCVAEGFIVYILSPTGSQFNPFRRTTPLEETYGLPTILKGVVQENGNSSSIFTTQDVVMFDGKWLQHLPLKIRKEFFANKLSDSYKSFKVP